MPSIDIDIDDRGIPTIGIADAAGEIRDYRIEAAPPGLSLWAVRLVRCDTGAAYHVSTDGPLCWSCDCPAQTYRKRGNPPCKHCEAARLLYAARDSLLSWLDPAATLPHPTA